MNVYHLQYTVYTYLVNNVYRTMCIVQCTMYMLVHVSCLMYNVQCTLISVSVSVLKHCTKMITKGSKPLFTSSHTGAYEMGHWVHVPLPPTSAPWRHAEKALKYEMILRDLGKRLQKEGRASRKGKVF